MSKFHVHELQAAREFKVTRYAREKILLLMNIINFNTIVQYIREVILYLFKEIFIIYLIYYNRFTEYCKSC